MKFKSIATLAHAAAFALAVALPLGASAQQKSTQEKAAPRPAVNYPTKTVVVLAPFSAGGSSF